MNNIITLGNIMKFDSNKCLRCKKCIYSCDTKALSMFDGMIRLDMRRCTACKKCLSVCKNYALYYNVNDGIIEGSNTTAIVPYNASLNFLNKKYSDVITYELGEKVKVIETAFEMENETSKKINEIEYKTLIISDFENIDYFISVKNQNVLKYLSKVKNVYYISSYIYRLLNRNKNVKIAAYAVPFESKMFFNDLKIIDEMCDIPFKMTHKYNILDILNAYICLGKFNNSQEILTLEIENNKVIILSNKYIESKILLINDLQYLTNLDYSLYDFIFVCKQKFYSSNGNILKDDEVNNLYKNKLKTPGKTDALFKRG